MNKYFGESGIIIKGVVNLSPRETFELFQKDIVLIDLRRENEIKYKSFPADIIIYATPAEIKTGKVIIPRDKPVVIADNAGLRSKEVTAFLLAEGYDNVANMIGGMFEWDKDKLPININNKERLEGSCLCVMRKPKIERQDN